MYIERHKNINNTCHISVEASSSNPERANLQSHKRPFLTHFPLPHQNPPFTPVFLCQNPCQNQSINTSPTRWVLTLTPPWPLCPTSPIARSYGTGDIRSGPGLCTILNLG